MRASDLPTVKIISLWLQGSVPHGAGFDPEVSANPVSARRTWSIVAFPLMRTGAEGFGAEVGAGVAPGGGTTASVTTPDENVRSPIMLRTPKLRDEPA
jgi:hypothetical protein